MKAATKYVLPVVVGAVTGVILISLGERLLQFKYPLAPEMLGDKASLARAIAAMPKEAFQLLLVNYAVASLGAGIVATLIAGRKNMLPAIITGILITLGGVFNNFSIPGQPQWFAVSNLFLYIPFALLGYFLVRKMEKK